MVLTEEEVYNGAKRWLRKNGYQVIAGQPARGVDHLPVIEIKLPSGDKGSRDSFKPDLVAYKNETFFIIECKPEYNDGDRVKILEVLASRERLMHFYNELNQYQLLKRVGFTRDREFFFETVRGILAFSGALGPGCEMSKLIVKDWKGQATLVET